MNLRHKLYLSLLACVVCAGPLLAESARVVIINEQRLYRDANTESKVTARVNIAEEGTLAGRQGRMLEVAMSDGRAGWTLANGAVVLDGGPYVPALLFDAAERLSRDDTAESWLSAIRLYRRTVSAKTDGPFAAEAQWRAASLALKIDEKNNTDLSTSPTMNEMKAIVQLYPHTPQAARAAFVLLQKELCDLWDATPGCPEAEITAMGRTLAEFPESEHAAELRYAIAYCHAALVEIYMQPDKPFTSPEKAVEHKAKAREVVAAMQRLNAHEYSWVARGERLLAALDNNIGVLSNIQVPLHRF